MSASTAIADRLAREVLRKLRLAVEADRKDDRDIICEEVFTDLTGGLDDFLKEQLEIPRDQNCRFYEILAPYFRKKWDAAEGLLYVSRKLLSQPYISPIYAMLLYQWLLANKDAGGAEQRQKHINLLTAGARQLFWSDVHSGLTNFQAMYVFIADEVALSSDRRQLDSLPMQSRAKLLAVTAAFVPYYNHSAALSQALASFPSVSHTAEDGGHVDWEGADFAILDICDTLRLMRAEPSLLKYLDALVGLRESPFLPRCKQLTRLRLQAELYALTQVGGPRYVPRSVNQAAFRVLDALFPMGKLSRRAVSLLFRLWLHPGEWPRAVWTAVKTAGQVCMAWLRLLSPKHWADRQRARRQRATSAARPTNGGAETELLLRKKR
ncbi:g8487 [Coccomyxa viridis]|uniref:G8487 protein n=1 Tax=Coccomyxa viridis TaxID=1274662 RepID=A0ABP1G0G7_9CHLO